MAIARDSVVTMHYTLKDDAGATLDSSAGSDPIAYLHGHGNIVPGLERQLEGKSAGDKLNVQLAPADGYGEYHKELVQQVPLRAMKGVSKVTVGMRLQAQTPEGPRVVTVTHVASDMVTIDGNHPLAGKSLNFEVEITDVRQATEEELSHGHVHGAGGHHH
jgi:FKBP-type peptidyl-prolyl cis-trans isomerase SlyD